MPHHTAPPFGGTGAAACRPLTQLLANGGASQQLRVAQLLIILLRWSTWLEVSLAGGGATGLASRCLLPACVHITSAAKDIARRAGNAPG